MCAEGRGKVAFTGEYKVAGLIRSASSSLTILSQEPRYCKTLCKLTKMVSASSPPSNAFVAAARSVYHPIGFSRGYNFIFFVVCIDALMGFVLARFQCFNFYGVFCSPNINPLGGANGPTLSCKGWTMTSKISWMHTPSAIKDGRRTVSGAMTRTSAHKTITMPSTCDFWNRDTERS